MTQTKGYAASAPSAPFAPFSFERRDCGPRDVVIAIRYCGICHSDIHQVRDEWGGSMFPMVPGHEIVGEVTAVGSDVTKFRVGDRAGVGCFVMSCRTCEMCKRGEEQLCLNGATFTYNSHDKLYGGVTYGGYSERIVVDQDYALKISPKVDLASTAPLLCAGITTYSPLRRWGAGPGKRVGVVGLGGLGHMALKLARSFGAHVVQFTTSPKKRDDALRLGAHEVVVSTEPKQMEAAGKSFDLVIDTVSANHDYDALLNLLKPDGTLVLIGVPPENARLDPGNLILARRTMAGAIIGGIRETQEMLDYCAQHGIASDVEVIPVQRIDEAYDRTVKSDVKYRFVIDLSTLSA